MTRAIITVLITIIVGILFMVIGNDYMKGLVELGILAAIAIAAGMIVFWGEQKNKKK